jgi:hypothetical protein
LPGEVVERVAEEGVMEIAGDAVIVTAADPDFVGSACDVAITFTCAA